MGVNPHHYAVEKLTATIEALATGHGDARSRVASAFLIFHTLRPEDFPPERQKDWERLMDEITKHGPVLDGHGRPRVGSVDNTMSRIRNTTASRVAQKLYELYWVVSENQQYK